MDDEDGGGEGGDRPHHHHGGGQPAVSLARPIDGQEPSDDGNISLWFMLCAVWSSLTSNINTNWSVGIACDLNWLGGQQSC